MTLYAGRFESDQHALFKALNNSLPFDWRLARHDILGSFAWAGAIHRAGVLDDDEHRRLTGALKALLKEAADLGPALATQPDEDVHSWVERRLIEQLGPLGKKLHTGRSRNDQVATDVRLWCRDEIDARLAELRAARAALIDVAQREFPAVMPGYTHLQRAQPILFSHWALAYEEMLARDSERFADARRRVNLCPLGSGALAGTAYPVDRALLAADLDFDGPTLNSLDATSDRDFVLETLSASATTAIHLSRLAEDLILWSSSEFGFVRLADEVTSGSSLMPQKKNPDACELLRGKAGRIIGAWSSLAVTLKGLPLAYNKDLQEDKEPLFDAMHHLSLCLSVVPIIFKSMKLDRERMRRAASEPGGHANATDLADYLARRGVPFREAHDITAKLVRRAIERGVALEQLPLEELRAACAVIEPDVLAALTLESSIGGRDALGGTSEQRVRAAIAAARTRLSAAS